MRGILWNGRAILTVLLVAVVGASGCRSVVKESASLMTPPPAATPPLAPTAPSTLPENMLQPQRWAVMTGVDPDTANVSTKAVATDVATLASISTPDELHQNGQVRPVFRDHRIGPIETTVWSVKSTLTSCQSMPDGDYRLILKDTKGRRLVCELPDPKLMTKPCRFAARMTAARATLVAKLHPTDKPTPISVPITVDGLGYYGRSHDKQSDRKTGGVQLHPLLDVKFSS